MQSNRECEAQILLPHLLEDGMVFPILCPPPGPKFLQGFFALCKILVRQKQFQVFALRQASDKVSGIEERVVRGRAHSHTSHRNGRPHLLGFKSAERTFCLRKQRTEEKNTQITSKNKNHTDRSSQSYMPSIRMRWCILRQALQHRVLPSNAQTLIIGEDCTGMLL